MVISIVNHKGGTGKTTTTINLGICLKEKGHKVLLVDFDAQGSLTYSLGIDEEAMTIRDALMEESPVASIITEREGLYVLPAGPDLADVEVAMANSTERFIHLENLFDSVEHYDYILIDCPPSLSLLTLNALVASDYVIVPMQMDVLALRGLDSMLETVHRIKPMNDKLEVLGVLPVMIEPRKNMFNEILGHIKAQYSVRVFESSIRSSVKAAEAPSFGKSVMSYAPSSTTANDYREFAIEVIRLSKQLIPES